MTTLPDIAGFRSLLESCSHDWLDWSEWKLSEGRVEKARCSRRCIKCGATHTLVLKATGVLVDKWVFVLSEDGSHD